MHYRKDLGKPGYVDHERSVALHPSPCHSKASYRAARSMAGQAEVEEIRSFAPGPFGKEDSDLIDQNLFSWGIGFGMRSGQSRSLGR